MKIPSNYNLFFYIFFMEYFGNVLLVYRDLPTMHCIVECMFTLTTPTFSSIFKARKFLPFISKDDYERENSTAQIFPHTNIHQRIAIIHYYLLIRSVLQTCFL